MMLFRLKQIGLLLWHYLNQPLLDRSGQTAFGLNRFLYLYRIQTLERCWQKKCQRQRQFYH
ncbi:MAG: hypothetical protein AAGG51_07490 [Cyanobacteria bacterium P01_G01_bin.54]